MVANYCELKSIRFLMPHYTGRAENEERIFLQAQDSPELYMF